MVVRTLAFVIVRRVLGLVGLGCAPDARVKGSTWQIGVPRVMPWRQVGSVRVVSGWPQGVWYVASVAASRWFLSTLAAIGLFRR